MVIEKLVGQLDRLTTEECEYIISALAIKCNKTVLSNEEAKRLTDAYVLQELRAGRFTYVPNEPEKKDE
jgi:hypothetical protein